MRAPTTSRIKRYFTVILRWLSITVVVFVLTILTGSYITDNFLPKVYTATAQIQIRPRGMTAVPAPNQGSFSDPLQGVLETMGSPDVLLPIINDLELDQAWAKRVFKLKEDRLSDKEALAYMNKILRLDYKRGTSIVEITAASDVPREAADIANAIADRYKTMRDPQQNDARRESDESPVRIISRAEPPTEPSRPNKTLSFVVMILVAGLLSVVAASFVEMMLLFSRASESPNT
jgi:uncharacterized protein involved in exopolysaccharide biosynthesis